MQKEVNEKISQLIDGELGYNETLELLKKIRSDEIFKQKMCRYEAIGQALKTDKFYQIKPDFSDKVFQQIQLEPTYLLPKKQTTEKPTNRNKLFLAAASTLAAAVLVGHSLKNNNALTAAPTLTANAMSTQPISLVQIDKPRQQKRQPSNAEFNDYLQAHNNSVYTNGEANFQPYAKVASYGRD